MHPSRSCHVREIAGPFFPTFISLASLLFNSRTEQDLKNIKLWNYIFFAKRCYLILLNSDFNNLPNFYKKRLWEQEWYFMLHMQDRKLGQEWLCQRWGNHSELIIYLLNIKSFLSSFLNSCEKASSFQLQDRQRCTWGGHLGWAEGRNTPCTDVACPLLNPFDTNLYMMTYPLVYGHFYLLICEPSRLTGKLESTEGSWGFSAAHTWDPQAWVRHPQGKNQQRETHTY